MSQGLLPAGTTSPSETEKSATSQKSNLSAPKLRSCVVCRTRKVRCDKLSPCSNCRRANIACVSPSADRPPRWARRLDLGRIANNAASAQVSQDPEPAAAQARVMERLRTLESLVKDLSGQLEHANASATANSTNGGSSGAHSPESSSHKHDRASDNQRNTYANSDVVQKQFGRIVLEDANQSRYVSSGVWSRLNDEIDELKLESRHLGGDSASSEDDEYSSPGKSSNHGTERSPSERHAFLFQHNLTPSGPDLRELHPLPSQIPFLITIFSENVNCFGGVLHIPTVTKLSRNIRGSDTTSLSPADEALMFSIYYAAITSMEEEDVMANFGLAKSDLNLKYRIGLEHALAKADFLNTPDLVLVQAFGLFLCLLRRHESPRFVWMMTGLLIRMAQALGLQRDGAQFDHLTPYEIEMRRRAWGALCLLDVRASEDQGTDFTVAHGSFDTKLPLNIDDADISPETTHMPIAREGITDMTLPLISLEISVTSRRIMDEPGIEKKCLLLSDIYENLERRYLQYSVESGNTAYWVMATVARLVMAKMTLFIYLPVLFSPLTEKLSDQIKNKLLIAAIELAEYNHALNAEQSCRNWRWVYQTYTHWYAIVYLLLEICRRPWSPIVERAWTTLHSEWLIPAQFHVDKNLRMWIPLRKLTSKARKHRAAELERLRSDPRAAAQLEMEDRRMPAPSSHGQFPTGSNAVELFREQWRRLLDRPGRNTETPRDPKPSTETGLQNTSSVTAYSAGDFGSDTSFEPAYSSTGQFLSDDPQFSTMPTGNLATVQNADLSYDSIHTNPMAWSSGFVPWLWADTNPSVDVFANVDVNPIDVDMDFGSDVDWYNWVESAKNMELDTGNIRQA